jgi:hypothetical protein
VRRHRLVNFLATIAVISLGVVTLIGLVSPADSSAATVTKLLMRLVAVVAAVAVVVGIVNLIMVHLDRFVCSQRGWPYSLLTLVVAVAVIVLRILDRADIWPDDMEGKDVSPYVFEAVQVSLEAALAAVVLFSLVFAAFRLMRRQVTPWYALFSAMVVVVLLGWMPLEGADALGDAYDWLLRVPVGAGARGILIGVGLGTVTVGVRVLLGQDRSFRS